MHSALFDFGEPCPVAFVGVEIDGDPRDFFFLPAVADTETVADATGRNGIIPIDYY